MYPFDPTTLLMSSGCERQNKILYLAYKQSSTDPPTQVSPVPNLETGGSKTRSWASSSS